MANNVFANGREISCKKADGKSICAFPDVCFTPPENPATPPGVPIPYPNTGMAKDTTSGSKKVQISKKEVLLKNKSYFKKSMGDEAGAAAKKGVLTSTNRGKVYFTMWSMDVKVEGQNVVRHFDMTTHNHMSTPGNTPPWPYVDSMSATVQKACEKEKKAEDKACKGLTARRDTKKGPGTGAILLGKTKENTCADTDEAKKCREAQKCRLVPQKEGCCPGSGQQAHHVVEAHGFYEASTRDNFKATALPEFDGYQPGDAPCVCAQGGRAEAEHGAFHAIVGNKENAAVQRAEKADKSKEKAWNYSAAKRAGIAAHRKIFPKSKCSAKCLNAQLDAYHGPKGATDSTPVRTENAGLADWQKADDAAVLNTMKKHLTSGTGAGGL